MLIGRFPLYTDLEIEKLEGTKFDYVLELVKKTSVAIYEFIKNAPDGVLRVLGPFRAKRSKSRLIIASPVPMIFQNLLLNLPRVSHCVTRMDRPYVEIVDTRDLFDDPAEYVLKIPSISLDLEGVKRDFKLFIGSELNPRFEFLELERRKNHMILHLRTLNRDATAMVKFLRFAGIPENRNIDVLIWTIRS